LLWRDEFVELPAVHSCCT